MKNVQKAIAITDAKISFVSLVDKAANKKQFLITKAEDGQVQFSTYGRIVKTDGEHHFVTGVVYEPMTEDAHGNFMTEEEITKAAYWFAKNGDGVDLQHSFETVESVSVVESWVAKSDFVCGEETVKKGSWLMTVEVTDDQIWDAVQKGEITGFSMGGVGLYATEDTELENEVEKTATETDEKTTERKGIFKKLAELFGFDVVEKGAVKDAYEETSKSSNFWNAFYALENVLYRYNYNTGTWDYENDETVIREALTDFNNIITDVLAVSAIAKSLAVEKTGKKLSANNKESLANIHKNLGTFLAEVEKEQEETEMTKSEIEKIVDDAVAKALNPEEPAAGETPAAPAEITTESVQKMVDEAVKKALEPKEEPVSPDNIEDVVNKAVEKALEPIFKSRALPSSLGEGNAEPVAKGEEHYLAGIL